MTQVVGFDKTVGLGCLECGCMEFLDDESGTTDSLTCVACGARFSPVSAQDVTLALTSRPVKPREKPQRHIRTCSECYWLQNLAPTNDGRFPCRRYPRMELVSPLHWCGEFLFARGRRSAADDLHDEVPEHD